MGCATAIGHLNPALGSSNAASVQTSEHTLSVQCALSPAEPPRRLEGVCFIDGTPGLRDVTGDFRFLIPP